MASALQKQLAVIASTRSNELDLKSQRASHSKSLLFEQSVAASQSFDLLWQICLEGYEELCALDSRFARFSQSIFGPHSRTEDRALMTEEENKDLDGVLESFLILVGPRLMLQPALKAVEWLVRRFRIHQQNIQSTILTFLPYYNTKLFPSLLSILPKTLPEPFRFLQQYKTSLSSPPPAVLVYYASRNDQFLSAFNNYVLSSARARCHHSALSTFWASTVGQAVNERLKSSMSGRRDVQNARVDDFLTTFLPVLNEALALKKVAEITLASYMITVITVSRANLGEDVLNALLEAVIASWNADTFEAGLACAAAIVDKKRDSKIPRRAARFALRFPRLGESLAALAPHQNVQPLLLGLLQVAYGYTDLTSDVDLTGVIGPLIEARKLDQQSLASIRRITAGAPESKLLSLGQKQPDEDEEMADADDDLSSRSSLPPENEPKTSKDLMADFSHLPSRLEIHSFLNADASGAFRTFSTVFRDASHNPDGLKRFLNMAVWQSREPTLLISLLVRTWCADQSVTVRAKSLELFHDLGASMPSPFPEQVLVYVLAALMDSSTRVRRSAAKAVFSVSERLQTSANYPVPPTAALYKQDGTSEGDVPTKALSLLVRSHVLPALEECISDPAHIHAVLESALTGASGSQDGDQATLKSSHRAAVMTHLAEHATLTPSPTAKHRFLGLAKFSDKIAGQFPSSFFTSYIKDWPSLSKLMVTLGDVEMVSVSALDKAVLDIVHPSDSEAVEAVVSMTASGVSDQRSKELQAAAFTSLTALWPDLKQTAKVSLGKHMLDAIGTSDAGLSSRASSFLQTISISPDTLISLVTHVLESLDSLAGSSTKKRRTNDGKSRDVADEVMRKEQAGLSKLGFVVETADSLDKVPNVRLFYALFEALRIVQEFSHRSEHDVDFTALMVLSSLLSIGRAFRPVAPGPDLDTASVRVDLVVDSIQRTNNAQIRNTGILLLGVLTKYVPDLVLQSVAPVFTLIGTATARQGDDYSIHVVDQTIREVIPALVAPVRENKLRFIETIRDILSSFAAAFVHIPPSRRINMFLLLSQSLGPKESLCAILSTLVSQHPSNGTVIGFGAQLLRQFDTETVLNTIVDFFQLLIDCASGAESAHTTLVCDSDRPEDDDNALTHLLGAAPTLISSGLSPESVAEDMHHEAASVFEAFRRLLVAVNTLNTSSKVTENPQRRKDCIKCLENTLKLLPFSKFIETITPLLESPDVAITRGVLKTYEVQLRSEVKINREAKLASLASLKALSGIIENSHERTLRLNAVICIDLICENFGKLDREATSKIVDLMVGPLGAENTDVSFRTLALHTIATCVEVLEDEFIPSLQIAWATACDSIQTSQLQEPDEKLFVASVSVAIAVVDHLPYMVSADMLQKILGLVHTSAKVNQNTQARHVRNQFTAAVASKADSQAVFKALQASWISAIKAGPRALSHAAELLGSATKALSKSTASKRSHFFLDSFFVFADIRRTISAEQVSSIYPKDTIEQLERLVTDAIVALVLKINDAAFRPFFTRMADWSEDLPKKDEAAKMMRWTATFKVLAAVTERLKGLVSNYFDSLIDTVTAVLSNFVEESIKAKKLGGNPRTVQYDLVDSAVKALRLSLQYDTSDFWATPARFKAIFPALLSLLPVEDPQSKDSFAQLHAIPALTALAKSVAGNHAQLMTLQKAILDNCLTANGLESGPKIGFRNRIAGIMTMRAIGRELGEEWLAELPRMLPVISELLEDNDPRVEDATGDWVEEMEQILGENITDMLA